MIKLLAIVVGVLFLLGCANTYIKSKRSSAEEKTAKFEAIVVHRVEHNSKDVKVLGDVFSWGREALGEYFFFAEIEKSALKPDGTGDLSLAEYFAEVTVSFESDTLNVANSELQSFSSGNYEPFDVNFQVGGVTLGDMNPAQLHSFLKVPEYVSIISTNDSKFSTFNADGFFKNVYFRSVAIDQGRVTEIKVWSKSKDTDVNWLYSRFNELIVEYQDIPMNKFNGAIRQ